MTSVGDVIYLHDSLLGSPKDVMRWCIVVAATGSVVRVAPRSASVAGAIFTPAGLLPEFTKDGWFSRWTVPVDSVSAYSARNIGQLQNLSDPTFCGWFPPAPAEEQAVNDSEFRDSRRTFLSEGRVTNELLSELRGVVNRLVLFGNLPPMYSPTGKWDEDAQEEVFADWIEARLVGTGQLAAMMHQTGSVNSFARLAELYLRRHLINRLDRNHATNLFGRLRTLLAEATDTFKVLVPSSREQDVVWTLNSEHAASGPYENGDDRLLSLAWGLGDFETVRFREDARKLSHVLERDELIRFVSGLMESAQGGLTLAQIVSVIVRRFDLEPAQIEGLGDDAHEVAAVSDVVEDVAAGQFAAAALAELTARQVEILRAQLGDQSVRAIAEELRISVGTVAAEQKRIAAVLSRLSDPDRESRTLLLNALRDLLF